MPPSEPNIGGFPAAASAAPDEPFTLPPMAASYPQGMLGTNQLQSAIDKFQTAVDKLASLYAQAASSVGALPGTGQAGGGSNNNGGGATFPAPVSGGGRAAAAMPAAAQGGGTGNNNGGSPTFAAALGAAGGALAGTTLGKMVTAGSQAAGGNVGPAVSLLTSGGNAGNPSFSGAGGGGIGSSPSALPVVGATLGGGLLGGLGAISSFGTQSLPTQLALNQMAWQAQLMSPPGSGNISQSAVNQAVGLNSWSSRIQFSGTDAAQAQAILNQASGTPTSTTTPFGQNLTATAQQYGLLNPALSATQSAQFAAGFNTPQNLLFRNLYSGNTTASYNQTPAGYAQSFIQGNISRNGQIPNAVAYNPNGGLAYEELQQQNPTWSASQLQAQVSINEAVGKLMGAPGGSKLTTAQINTDLTSSSPAAIAARKAAGLPASASSDLANLKQENAAKTAQQGDIYGPFTEGLQNSAQLLTQFNTAITNILSNPILAKAIGYPAGAAAGAPGAAGKIKNAVGGAAKGAVAGAVVGSIVPGLGTGVGAVVGGALGLASSFFSEGGTVPGYAPGQDTQTIQASPGEGILVPEAVKALGGSDTIDAINKAFAGFRGGGSQPHGGVNNNYATGGTVSGNMIASDAEKYIGSSYHYGGPSSPGQWDCSSFVDYVVGHDENLLIPGGTWARETDSGKAHGPNTVSWAGWSGTKMVGANASSSLAGDIVLWQTHMGISLGGDSMVSALDEAQGTQKTTITGGGPSGESFAIRRLTNTTPGSTGSGTSSGTGSSTTTTTTTGTAASAVMGFSPSSTSEVANVAAGLGGGTGAGMIGGATTTTTTTAAPGGGSSSTGGTTSSGGGGGGSATAPSTPSGGYTQSTFAQALLKMLGDPVSSSNVAALVAWENQEGGNWNNQARYNPLNTTQREPGSTSFESVGAGAASIAIYPSWAEGLKGTYDTLKNGDYANILAALKSGKSEGTVISAIENSPWGTGHINYAEGTNSAKRGTALVGERGPELVYLSGGQKILDAKGTQQATAGITPPGINQVTCSTSSATKNGMGGVSLIFGANSIVVNNNSTSAASGSGQAGSGSAQASSNAAREIVRQLRNLLAKEDLYDAIAAGQKGG